MDITEALDLFPEFRVAVLVARDLRIEPGRTEPMQRAISEILTTAAAELDEHGIAEMDALVAWREAYKAFGVKKTSYRSSVERLLKSVKQGRRIAEVNSLVDAYNALSIRYHMPIGADDFDKVVGDVAFRRSRPGDRFVALGDRSGTEDPPKADEIVYADQEKVLCRRWNWYQHAASAISLETNRAVLTVQSLGTGELVEDAAEELVAWLQTYCSGAVSWAVAELDHPKIRVGAF